MLSNVVHVTSWLTRQGGGIPPVIWNLARQTKRLGLDCSVAGLHDHWINEDCLAQQVPFVTGAIQGPASFGYSPALSTCVRSLVKPGSVVHSHGLWMHPGIVARNSARSVQCPLIVSPHGMLEPWALKNSGWKKRLAAWLFENHNLRSANCLHALCAAEAENFRRYDLRNPIAVIPNGVTEEELLAPSSLHEPERRSSDRLGSKLSVQRADLEIGAPPRLGVQSAYPSGNSLPAFEDEFPVLKDRRRLLFLSRLHPKKGLENLFLAWRELARRFPDWCLIVAGSGEAVYEQQLKTLVKTCNLNNSVVFTGPVFGSEKQWLLATSDAFILPSFSEGFSMAILEAAAAAMPVLLTPECNFPELAKAGGAIEIRPAPGEIEDALRHILSLSDEQRKAMGQRGSALVRKSYTWPVIAAQMCAVYQWLAGNAPKPDCVI